MAEDWHRKSDARSTIGDPTIEDIVTCRLVVHGEIQFRAVQR